MTPEERLDELIALAKDLAEYEVELAQYERDAEAYSARTEKGRRARKFLPNARSRVEVARGRLDGARDHLARSLADLEAWASSFADSDRAPQALRVNVAAEIRALLGGS